VPVWQTGESCCRWLGGGGGREEGVGVGAGNRWPGRVGGLKAKAYNSELVQNFYKLFTLIWH
jgi:hypothetical protein